jgi:DNA-binding transcriptional ArsR family regulator
VSAEARAHAQRHSPLKGNSARYLVHLLVADVVNDLHRNEFWMTVPAVAEACGVSGRTVQRALSDLVDAGVLEVVEDGGGRGAATRYRYHPEWRTPPRNGDTVAPNTAPERVTATPETVTPCPERVTASHRNGDDTSIGNQREPKGSARQLAETLVRSWWESTTPRPVVSFIGVVKLVERFLDAGHDEAAVARALAESPTPTANALTFALNRRSPSARPQGSLAMLRELHAEATEEASR